MRFYDLLIIIIVIIKIIFLLLKVGNFYNKVMGKALNDNFTFWADRVEFIYTFLMAIMLIYLFRGKSKVCIYDKETIFLLYVFGIILLLTADWSIFIHESVLIENVREILGLEIKNK
jgi:hypothetical protein